MHRPASAYEGQPAGNWSRFRSSFGHISVQTTERYLGCAQRIASTVKDKIGIEPAEHSGKIARSLKGWATNHCAPSAFARFWSRLLNAFMKRPSHRRFISATSLRVIAPGVRVRAS